MFATLYNQFCGKWSLGTPEVRAMNSPMNNTIEKCLVTLDTDWTAYINDI